MSATIVECDICCPGLGLHEHWCPNYVDVEDDDEIEGDDAPSCAACGGELVLLGALGKTVHYRCRACGLDQSA